MNELKTVLRLADQGLSQRQIAAAFALGQATASDYLTRARAAGLRHEEISDWRDEQLLASLGVRSPTPRQWCRTAEPDFTFIQRELQADKTSPCNCSIGSKAGPFCAAGGSSCCGAAANHGTQSPGGRHRG